MKMKILADFNPPSDWKSIYRIILKGDATIDSINEKIQSIFSEVPKTYEKVNHMLTFGLDILWRKRMVQQVLKKKPKSVLDVCTGTGETAVYLKKRTKAPIKIIAVDFTQAMIQIAAGKSDSHGIDFCLADVKALPFDDNTFDAVTLSFATRNLNIKRHLLIAAFSEICRVLKPGGVFYNLETSQPKVDWIRFLFHKFIGLTVLPLGRRLSGSQKGYHYLANTIPRFYSADELTAILLASGFSTVQYSQWMFGVAALHFSSKTRP